MPYRREIVLPLRECKRHSRRLPTEHRASLMAAAVAEPHAGLDERRARGRSHAPPGGSCSLTPASIKEPEESGGSRVLVPGAGCGPAASPLGGGRSVHLTSRGAGVE